MAQPFDDLPLRRRLRLSLRYLRLQTPRVEPGQHLAPPYAVPLLHQQSGAGPVWFVQDILAAVDASAKTTPPGAEGLVDPLSDREQVVLSYLPSWVSSSEIAAELYISLNTLKSHLRSIYRKLGVSSRREAVVQARSRGLL